MRPAGGGPGSEGTAVARMWLAPDHHARRLRLLLLGLVLLVGIVTLVDVLWLAAPARNPSIVVAGVSAMLGWAVLRWARRDLWLVADLVPLGAVFVLGLWAATPEAAFGPTVVLLCFRVQFGGWTAALVNALAYALAFLMPYVVRGPQDASRPVAALLLIGSLVLVAAIMHGIMLAAKRQERSLRRERVLSQASAALLTASSEDDVLEQMLGAISRLGDGVLGVQLLTPEGAAHERCGQFGATLLAPGLGSGRLRLERLPHPGSSGLERGETLQLDGETCHHVGLIAPRDDPPPVGCLLAALRVRDQLEAIVATAVGGSESLDELAVLVVRLVDEAALAVGRLRLTDELHRTNAVRARFLSMLSHELRAPLTIVGGVLDTLRERSGSLSASAIDELLAVGQRHVGRQRRLIDDVLLTARTLERELPVLPTRIDVPSFVAQLLVDLVLDELTSVTTGPGEPVAWVDDLHLAQILTNLLINARKYGSPPLEVGIVRRGDQVIVEVQDHGSGIPEDLMPRLFEPFEQATESRSAADGVGLGLSISRQLAHANRGELDVLPVHGRGARFRLVLPAFTEDAGDHGPGTGQLRLLAERPPSGAGGQEAV